MADSQKNNKRINGWIIGGASVLLLALGAYFIFGYVIYDMVTVVHTHCESDYMEGRRDFTPANFKGIYDYPEINIDVTPYLMSTFETVSFPAREDGVNISAWLVSSETPTDRVVIVVHGGDVCRRNTSVLLPAGMLVNNGFDVLLIDLRNHGDSEVVTGRFTAGVTEYRDVLGAFDWLVAQGYEPEKIGLMGVSLGAATSVDAFGADPGIAALWADSSFADFSSVVDDQLALNGIPRFLKNAVFTAAWLDGIDLEGVSPVVAITHQDGRPVMLVQGTADEWVNVEAAHRLYEASNQMAGLWIVEGTRHVEAMFVYPEEYTQSMIDFFNTALGE